jgi:hypothetical protein
MNIEKEFVPYQESLELKELGFDEPCLCFYNYNSQLLRYMNPDKDWNSLQSQTLKNSKITLPDTYSAPTFSQCFKWFREKYGLFIQPNRTIDSEGTWYYFSIASKRTDVCDGSFVYEEAELACLIKLIEIVKENKQ